MSYPTPPANPRRGNAVRELIGLLLIVLGVAGLDAVLFAAFETRIGLTAVAVEVIVLGVALAGSEV